VSEGEPDRLRRALRRLMDGHREALGVIDRGLEDQEDARSILGGEEGAG
jgi:HPt (histidine-containing phosphotransfer) domain-containing protein